MRLRKVDEERVEFGNSLLHLLTAKQAESEGE